MKTTLLRNLIALAATALLFSDFSAAAQVDQKKQTYESFSSITVRNDFEATLTPGKEYSVTVTTEEDLLPYVQVSVVSRSLDISLAKLPKELKKKYKGKNAPSFKVDITAPEVASVSLEDNAVLTTASEVSAKQLTLSLGGKSRIRRFDAQVEGKASIMLAKSATGEVTLSADQLSVSASGSASLRVSYEVETLASFALKNVALISASGNSEKVNLSAEGSSKLSLSGTAKEQLDVNADGSASLDALHLSVPNAKVVMTGGTLIEAASETLSMDLSGRSSLVFDKNPVLTIVAIKTSSVSHYSIR